VPAPCPRSACPPNNPLELTAHSAGFVGFSSVFSCGPQLSGSVRHRSNRQSHSGYHRVAIDLSTYIWTEYLKHRVRSRRFDLAIIEQILSFSPERYLDMVTRRMVVVGRHGHCLVIVPYDQEGDIITPVTIHATTRPQINLRLRTGRFIVP
jgi:hypothetical protein